MTAPGVAGGPGEPFESTQRPRGRGKEENGPIDVDHPWYSRAGPDRFPALRHLGFCVGLGLVVVLFVYGLSLIPS